MTTPLFMRNVSLTLKLVTPTTRVQFNCDCKTAEIVTTPGDAVTTQTLCANGSFTEIGKSSYELHIVAVQDWTATGLARFLWDHEGEIAEFQYQAHGSDLAGADIPSTSKPGMTGSVRLVAPNYGGEAENYAELDVTMPCSQKPTIATAVFPTLADEETTLGLEPDAVPA